MRKRRGFTRESKLDILNELNVKKAAEVCREHNIHPSILSNWKKEERQEDLNKYLRKEIEGIALEFPFYGYRRISKELQRRDLLVNHKRVLRLMREENLLIRRKKAFRPVTTDSDHNYSIYPNLIKDIEVTGLNQVWVSDITYIRLLNGFVYLAAIIDIFSRKCIGWALGRNIDAMLAIETLNMAIANRKHLGFIVLIHH